MLEEHYLGFGSDENPILRYDYIIIAVLLLTIFWGALFEGVRVQ